ncbi:MAG: HpsJ family protein [Cyanobacteriota bacterium]
MRPLDNHELSPPPSPELQELDFSVRQALQILRWLGYGLLIFTLIDWIYTLTPLKAMNPIWEFQTIGLLVDKVIVPLLALSLVFAGAELERGRWELRFLKLLSWLTLLIGILYLLLVPLGILNTVRIDQLNQRQINRTEESQLNAIRSVESRIPEIVSEDQLNEVIYLLNQGGLQVSPMPGQSLDSIKSDLTTFTRGAREKLGAQLQDALKQQRFDLLRNSVKWNLGAFIAAVWFIGFWRLSEWTRM